MNQDSKSKFVAAKATVDLADHSLMLFKPQTIEITLKGQQNPEYNASLLVELCYMNSAFIRCPIGNLRIEATNVKQFF